MSVHLTLDEVEALAREALVGSGASAENAAPVALSIRDAEAEGIRNVGLAYLPVYCAHLRCDKVNGKARPKVEQVAPGAIRVDAQNGFCHPAFTAAEADFIALARSQGIAALAIDRSYSAGVVGWFVERLANAGLVSLAFANASALAAPYGGATPFFGTNPMGFGAPRQGKPPLIIDMSTTATARVNVVALAEAGKPIPAGWALDRMGKPTTDPKAALEGTVAPLGGYKGTCLALMVDVLAAGLTGGRWSFESSSLLDNNGGPPGIGQLFIALDPGRLGEVAFAARFERMVAALIAQDGVILPGDRRHAMRAKAQTEGVSLPESLHEELRNFAA